MAPERPRRALRDLALAALLALALTACDAEGAGSEPPSNGAAAPEPAEQPAGAPQAEPPEAAARTVRTVRPQQGTLSATRSASASIQPARASGVAPAVAGRVDAVLARPGDVVEAGELVIQLDDDEARLGLQNAQQAVRSAEIELRGARRASGETIAQREASLRAARLNLDQAEEALADGRALYEAGGIARSELRSLEAQREEAESNWINARDALARAERSEEEDLASLEVQLESARTDLERARQRLEDARLTAPFAGEVAQLFVEAGEFAAAGTPAFRLESIDEQEAVVDLPPEDAQRLRARGEITLHYGGLTYAAHVVGAARPADQPRTTQLTASIYPSEARIPNGARAELRYSVDLADGLLLPSSAVHAEGGDTVVYRAVDGFAVRTPVRVRAEAGGRVVVDGLEPDAAVVSPRPMDVRDGTRVRVQAPDG